MSVRHRPIDLARAAGIHEQSVRKYERWGFLPRAERESNGYRKYGEQHLAALLCSRTLIAGYGWMKALTVMRLVHKDAVQEALALVDEVHATLHAERQSTKRTLEMLSVLAGEEMLPPKAKRPGPPGARQDLYVREVAVAAGVAPSAVRFWEEQGLITPRRDRDSRYRLYSPADVQRVKLISTLRQANYSFEAIRSVLDGLKAGRPELARAAAEARLRQLTAASERCAAATSALFNYIRDFGDMTTRASPP